jgi:hypothetical protein
MTQDSFVPMFVVAPHVVVVTLTENTDSLAENTRASTTITETEETSIDNE